ncbi:kinesin-like protein KIF18A [Panonychus citri]|uniref:kinesin-like protein KIF18A n=1 Tax=Panonychus citri TaxID=50023 RepID=UPI0023079C0A|nr:kinesin-like protein KIF18A [Panonychus citri]
MNRILIKKPFSNSTNVHNNRSVYEPPAKQKTVIREDDDDDSELSRIGPNNNIQVYIRVRPENERESRTRRIIEVVDDQSLLFDPLTDDGNTFTYHGKKYKDIGKKANKDLSFSFDAVFDEGTTNIQVYERAVKGFVQSLLDGFNCTIFAYGPTGSGKTFTMLGYNGDPGVIFYTAMEIFHNIEQRPSDEQYEVCVAYFEIYNEKVRNLLTPSSQVLKVVDSMSGGVDILGLTLRTVGNADELIETLETGNQYRAQQATDANATSSRSHAVFQLFLRKKTCPKGKQLVTQETKMCLVDLAGSERASIAYKEKRSETLHREGININKSLLALGNCINALACKSRKGLKKHIPYRSSVLTRILSDSLGGNCRTAMIATVSPSSLSYDDTHNTLSYANRAKGINLAVKRRSSVIGVQPRHQQMALDASNQENISLAEDNILLEQQVAESPRIPANPITADSSSLDILNSYQNILDEKFKKRLELRRKLVECDDEIEKIKLKYLLENMLKDSRQQNEGADENKDDKREQYRVCPMDGCPYTIPISNNNFSKHKGYHGVAKLIQEKIYLTHEEYTIRKNDWKIFKKQKELEAVFEERKNLFV